MESWLRIFIRKLFPHTASRLDIDGAFSVKHDHVPKKLYKYRAFNNYSREALKSDQLWFSSPSNFNDPFDTTIFFDTNSFLVDDLSVDQVLQNIEKIKALEKRGERWEAPLVSSPVTSSEHWRKLFDEACGDVPEKMREKLWDFFVAHKAKLNVEMMKRMSQHLRDGFSVLSLSANPTSNLMWSHYADSHKGLCIEYDFGVLDQANIRKRLCLPVLYRSRQTNATRFMSVGRADFNNLFGIYVALTKKSDWAYEEEWRIVHPLGSEHANGLKWMPEPCSIIVGAETNDVDTNWVEDFCARRTIPLKRATLDIATQHVTLLD